jgi:hypothetical protein
LDLLTHNKVHSGSKTTGKHTVVPVPRAISPEPCPLPGMKRLQAEAHESGGEGEDEVEESDGGDSTEEEDEDEGSDDESDDGSDVVSEAQAEDAVDDEDSSEENVPKRPAKSSMPLRLSSSSRPQAPSVSPWFEFGREHLIELAQVNRDLDLAMAGSRGLTEMQYLAMEPSLRDQQVRCGLKSIAANEKRNIEELELNAASVRSLGKLGIMFSRLHLDEATGRPRSNWASNVGPHHCDYWYDCEGILQSLRGADPIFQEDTQRLMAELPSPAGTKEPSRILGDAWENMKPVLARGKFQTPRFRDANGKSYRPDWTRWTKDNAGAIAHYLPLMYPILSAHRSAFTSGYPKRPRISRSGSSAAGQEGGPTYTQPTHYPSQTQAQGTALPSARQWTSTANFPTSYGANSGLRQEGYAPSHAPRHQRSPERHVGPD